MCFGSCFVTVRATGPAFVLVLALVAAACGSPLPSGANGAKDASRANGANEPSAPPPLPRPPVEGPGPGSAPPSGTARAPRPDTAAIYARIRADVTACYTQGTKAHPEMRDGRVTLNASIDAAGKTTCVVPSQDSGLTQDVESCMASAFAKQSFPASDDGRGWNAAVPVVVRAGDVQLGEKVPDWSIGAGPETWHMPDAFEAVEALLPALESCMKGMERASGLRSVMVGARINADGRPECALASASAGIPVAVADCSAAVLRGAKFPPPKGGPGLVVVPLTISSK